MSQKRRGFTLVELLVVAGIMAVLFSLIVVSGRAKPTALRAAQDFASMLLAAQSRALGKPQGAALMIETDAGTTRLGSVIHEADALPPIVIDEVNVGISSDFPDLVTTRNFTAGNSTLLQSCYKVRFRRKYGPTEADARTIVSPWLGLQARSLGNSTVGFPVRRTSAGQTIYNTSFGPRYVPEDVDATRLTNFDAVVIRHPAPGLSSTKVPSNLAMDLTYSGVGDSLTASHGYGTFNGTTADGMSPLAIVFDQTGRVSEVIQQVKERELATNPLSPGLSIEHPEWRDPGALDPLVPNEIIYFLFVDRLAIANDQSLASESAAWVALDPLTGRISVSSNVAGSTDIVAARERARSAVAFGK